MAKKSKIAKEKHIEATIAKYASKRAALKKAKDYAGLAKLPRDASPVRAHHRDLTDGRPHGYMRDFGLSRLNFRKFAYKGEIPGVRKASW